MRGIRPRASLLLRFGAFGVTAQEAPRAAISPTLDTLSSGRKRYDMVPPWRRSRTMSVNLSIKNVPADVVERLRRRAERRRRSLQGELLSIVEQAVQREHPLSPLQLLVEIRRLDVHTPAGAATTIRIDRERH
jgi:plasmid stability protein